VNLKPRECSAVYWILISAKEKKDEQGIYTGCSKEMFQLRLIGSADMTEGH